MAYTAEQKAMALAVIGRHGGELTTVALDEIRQLLELPQLGKTTVWRWWQAGAGGDGSKKTEQNGTKNETELVKKRTPTAAMVEAAETSLDKLYEQVTRRYLEHALKPDVIDNLKGQQAVTSAAIATDKMRLLQGLPTEIIGVLPGIIESANLLGLNAGQLLVQMKQRLDAEVANRAVLN